MAALTTLGEAAFVVGVLFAIFGGIWGGAAEPTNRAVVAVLLIAGIVIGLLNITADEVPVRQGQDGAVHSQISNKFARRCRHGLN